MGFPRVECASNLLISIGIHGINLNQIRYWWVCLSLRSKTFVFRIYDFFFQNVCHVHLFLWVPLLTSWSQTLMISSPKSYSRFSSGFWVTTFSIMSVLNVTVRLFFQKYYFHGIIFYLVTCYNFLYPHKSTSNFWAKKGLLLMSPFLVSNCVHQSALCCNLSIRMRPWFWLSL